MHLTSTATPTMPSPEPNTASQEQTTPRLTRRERQVLVRIAEGHTNKQMAAELGISPRTIETHRESMTRKLGIMSVAGLTRYVIENRITDDDC